MLTNTISYPGPSVSATALGAFGLAIGHMVGTLASPAASATQVAAVSVLVQGPVLFDTDVSTGLPIASPSQAAVGPFTVVITNNT